MHTYAQIYFSLAWAILFNTPPPSFILSDSFWGSRTTGQTMGLHNEEDVCEMVHGRDMKR